MNPEHAALLAEIRLAARPVARDGWPQNDSYGGSGRRFYFVSVPARRAIAKRWLTGQRKIADADFLAVVESLFGGESHEEKTLAALLLGYHARGRRAVIPSDIERWLGELNGWAEVDCLCAGPFSAEEMASDWPGWRGLIERLRASADINRRRAALVLLTGPVRRSPEGRFADLALETIQTLEAERNIMVTKAISWLLRSMVDRRRSVLESYLAEHADSLPKIAVRETRTKLATGVKSGRPRRGRQVQA